jgi:hypothetical protein
MYYDFQIRSARYGSENDLIRLLHLAEGIPGRKHNALQAGKEGRNEVISEGFRSTVLVCCVYQTAICTVRQTDYQ